MLYKKNLIKFLCRQLQFANMEDDMYFQPGHCRKLDAGVQYTIISKLFSNIYNERKKEVICSKRDNVEWNGKQEGGESHFLGTFKYLQKRWPRRSKAEDWSNSLGMLFY